MRMLFAFTMSLSALATSRTARAQPPCAERLPAAGARFYIERVAAGRSETTVRARLCVASGAPGIGSYLATIGYDSTVMRVARVETPAGMQAVNSRVAGSIRIAGAAPGGFANGQLAIITFKPSKAVALGRLMLTVTEVNTPAGESILAVTRTDGWPVKPPSKPVKAAKPVLDSITPRGGEVSPERVTDIVLHGRGFAASGNSVVFDGAEVTGLLSERGGTVIRFTAPTWIPARGSSPAHRVLPGPVEVRVKTASGSSNPLTFRVREEDQ